MKRLWQKYQLHIIFWAILLSIIIFSGLASSDWLTGGSDVLSLNSDELTQGSKREEIQRYLGYERLLFRYLTLPYDISMNINQIGRFVDIGFIFILLLPLLFMWQMKRRMSVLLIGSIGFLLLLILGVHTSGFIDYQQMSQISTADATEQFLLANSFANAPFAYILAVFRDTTVGLYSVLDSLTGNISSEKDYITLPLLVWIFCYLGIYLIRRPSQSGQDSTLYIFVLVFGFFWLLLAGGIIWYGFLMIAVLLMMMIAYLYKSLTIKSSRWLGMIGLAVISLWTIVAISSRISNVQPLYISNDISAKLMNHSIAKYNTGILKDEATLIDEMHPYLSATLKEMNSRPETLIYKVGTSFNAFVDQNNERVYADNQLVLFKKIAKEFSEPEEMVNVLKASNFRYLIIDLNIASLDFTPEKTLSSKFTTLVNFLYDNEQLRLLNTDRVVDDPLSEQGYRRAVFGEIIFNGSYAIYELI